MKHLIRGVSIMLPWGFATEEAEMAYRASELDRAQREAEEQNALMARLCPIAAALQREIDATLNAIMDHGVMDDTWGLLSAASNTCTDAMLAGRDLDKSAALDVAQVILFAEA